MNRLTVISLGGGVQSTVMALMAGDGACGGVPDCAIARQYSLGTTHHIRSPGAAVPTPSVPSLLRPPSVCLFRSSLPC